MKRILLFLLVLLLCSCDTRTTIEKIYPDLDHSVCIKMSSTLLIVDSAPSDRYECYDIVPSMKKIHDAFGLPNSLISTITNTRQMDGTISRSFGNVYVVWSFSERTGLEIGYREYE